MHGPGVWLTNFEDARDGPSPRGVRAIGKRHDLNEERFGPCNFIAVTPAAAEPRVVSSQEIRFRKITFTCGQAHV